MVIEEHAQTNLDKNVNESASNNGCSLSTSTVTPTLIVDESINGENVCGFDSYHGDSATDLTNISEFSKIFWSKSFTLFHYVCNPHRQCEECLNLVEGEHMIAV